MFYGKSPSGQQSSFGRSNNNFSKPWKKSRFSSSGNHYSNPQRSFGGGGKRQSKLLHADVNIFIKKASENIESVEVNVHNSFEEFNISPMLLQNIKFKNYTKPTPIQDQAIKPIMEGKDLIGLANTGTGKTAAFLIPLIDKVYKNKYQEKVLIVAPTRELALQIRDEFVSFSEGMGIFSALVIGGTNMQRQIRDIKRNPQFVIATPGRLKDLVERRILDLRNFSNIVLDEVDLMVDIGFIHDVKYFIAQLPEKRQSLFFSATISRKVQEILQVFVKDPVTVSIQQQPTSENVDQDIIRVLNREKKIEQLHDLLITPGFDKVLIFGRTKHGIERLNRELEYRGFKTGAIHGNKNQSQRQRTLRSFKENEIKILLATDVAARGLDIDNVTHVINYELPETFEDYIHRIGRTGRANNKGIALTFVD